MASPAAIRERARQTILEAIERTLSKLSEEDARVVSEDVQFALERGRQRPLRQPEPPAQPAAPSEEFNLDHPLNGGSADHGVIPLWQRIEEYCRSHPTKDGIFDPGVIAKALFPNGPSANFRTLVYVTVKRKSPQSDRGKSRDPRFVMLRDNRFRLFERRPTPAEDFPPADDFPPEPPPQATEDDIPF